MLGQHAAGRDVIIELNDTAPGLMFEHEQEDAGYMRDLVLQRMNEVFCNQSPAQS